MSDDQDDEQTIVVIYRRGLLHLILHGLGITFPTDPSLEGATIVYDDGKTEVAQGE